MCRHSGSLGDVRIGLGVFFLVLAYALVVTSPSVGQDLICDNARLEQAQASFDLGLFVDVCISLTPCLPDGFEGRERRLIALRLMTLSHIAIDSLDAARDFARQLVKTDPKYRVSPETDPPRFASMVQDLKPRWYTWLWNGNEWYKWTGRVAIVGSAVALPMLLKKDKIPDLPLPPAFPER